jgi:hypothetical protein
MNSSAAWLTGVLPHWFGTISLIATVLGSIGVGSMMKTWLDYRRGMRTADDTSAMALIEQQRIALDRANARIDRLERSAARKDELHELRMGQLRHRLNNMRMIFEVAIHLMKTSSSERMPEIVTMIEQMRAKHEHEEAAETAAIMAALAAGQAEMEQDARASVH